MSFQFFPTNCLTKSDRSLGGSRQSIDAFRHVFRKRFCVPLALYVPHGQCFYLLLVWRPDAQQCTSRIIDHQSKPFHAHH
eukprot:4885351-Amphidinium_carterae.1